MTDNVSIRMINLKKKFEPVSFKIHFQYKNNKFKKETRMFEKKNKTNIK